MPMKAFAQAPLNTAAAFFAAPGIKYAIVSEHGWLIEYSESKTFKPDDPYSVIRFKWGAPHEALLYDDYFEASNLATITHGEVLPVLMKDGGR